MQYGLAALGCLVSVAYWPDIAGAANSPRWIALGFGVPILLLLYPERVRLTNAHLFGLLFCCWTTAGILWSSSIDDTLGELLRLALMAGAFCLGSLATSLRPFYIGVAIGLIPSGIIAFARYLGYDWLPEIAPPSGLFVNRNFYAEPCALIAVALISERLWWFLPITAPGLLLTGARGALLALVTGIAPLIWRNKRFGLIAVCALALVGVALEHKGVLSLEYRLDTWKATALHLSFFGEGLGTFTAASPKIGAYIWEHPHNEFLEYAFETGILGFALLCAFFVVLFRTGLSTETLVLSALLVESFFEFPLHKPLTALIGACVAGHLSRRLGDAVSPAWHGRARVCLGYVRDRFRQGLPSSRRGAKSLPL